MKLEMMRQLPMPVQMRMAAPIKAARALVSATDPGMVPMKQFMRENMPPSANMAKTPLETSPLTGWPTVLARWPRAVAPVYPSASAPSAAPLMLWIQISPDICFG